MQTLRNNINILEMAWGEFLSNFRKNWQPGEHVSILGTTGSGKTTLMLALMPLRRYVVFLGTKAQDIPVEQALRTMGYRFQARLKQREDINRYAVWPRLEKIESREVQRVVMREALRDVYQSGAYTLVVDEAWYVADMLRLSEELKMLWAQGRSLNISMLAATQRPAAVPLMMYSQASHLFFFQMGDSRDLARINEIGGLDSKIVRDAVRDLPRFSFLYVNTLYKQLIISKVE